MMFGDSLHEVRRRQIRALMQSVTRVSSVPPQPSQHHFKQNGSEGFNCLPGSSDMLNNRCWYVYAKEKNNKDVS